jgi:carbon-monoxide dehydrogenase medium subunit
MYPAKFEYAAPASLEEALELLADRDDEARVLAGGQSLLPLLKLRFAAPALLVDLGRIPELSAFERRGGALRLGALVRHAELAAAPEVSAPLPLLASTAGQVADPLVRNLGTLCGSLAHADPRGDWAAAMTALDAELELRSRAGRRRVAIRAFYRGDFETALAPGEIVESVGLPLPAGRAWGQYLKLERKVGDFATVGAAVQLELAADGAIRRAGIGLTAVGSPGLRAERAEAHLAGAEPSEARFEEAARLAAHDAQPSADARGSADYKRHVVAVYVGRALRECAARARALPAQPEAP